MRISSSGAGRPERSDVTTTSPVREPKSSTTTSGPSGVRTAHAYRPFSYRSAPATAWAERYHVIQARSYGAGSASRSEPTSAHLSSRQARES